MVTSSSSVLGIKEHGEREQNKFNLRGSGLSFDPSKTFLAVKIETPISVNCEKGLILEVRAMAGKLDESKVRTRTWSKCQNHANHCRGDS